MFSLVRRTLESNFYRTIFANLCTSSVFTGTQHTLVAGGEGEMQISSFATNEFSDFQSHILATCSFKHSKCTRDTLFFVDSSKSQSQPKVLASVLRTREEDSPFLSNLLCGTNSKSWLNTGTAGALYKSLMSGGRSGFSSSSWHSVCERTEGTIKNFLGLP